MSIMPAIFVGHGSPMIAIEDSPYSRTWAQIAAELPKPEAILSISAHWYTKGTRVMVNDRPRTIHDFYGFPEALYRIMYPASGAPDYARKARELLGDSAVFDESWGLDHGTWCVLRSMYPEADIPVFQVSVDRSASPEEHYALGRKLFDLRNQGVMIFGSGNVVHNLSMIDWSRGGGYDWAYEFDNAIVDHVLKKAHQGVIEYQRLGRPAQMAVPTLEHFLPLLYVLGAVNENDLIRVYNQVCTMGSLSMTSYVFA
ncbi:4,5-DOPA dioxygenase extradiol [Dendrosporobacter sp. 1207_IL3150]|uniref:4,5-DOPA-extradiol-dioxygenase n=1 Tax=Dendrosporobacter sp. 1207_IL3150 TaxID=3084054 RepID=UPI002FDAAB3B